MGAQKAQVGEQQRPVSYLAEPPHDTADATKRCKTYAMAHVDVAAPIRQLQECCTHQAGNLAVLRRGDRRGDHAAFLVVVPMVWCWRAGSRG